MSSNGDIIVIDNGADERSIIPSMKGASVKLVRLRQESILDFYSSGGKRKKPKFIDLYTAKPMIPPKYYNTNTSVVFNLPSHGRSVDFLSQRIISSRFFQTKNIFDKTQFVGTRGISRRFWINIIKFDASGVLFAVGGSDGILRIYDFDECVGHLQKTRTHSLIQPIIIHDTKRNIADIAWSHADEDTIAVSYFNSPVIDIFNLNDIQSNQISVTVGRNVFGGHKCLLYVPLPQNQTRAKYPKDKLIAGSSQGLIRMWDRLDRLPNKVTWEVYGDPSVLLTNSQSSSTSSLIHEIVGLLHVDEGTFLSANNASVFVLWDYKNLKATTFGFQEKPVCLKRFAPTELCRSSSFLIGISATRASSSAYSNTSKTADLKFLATYGVGNVFDINFRTDVVGKLCEPFTNSIQDQNSHTLQENMAMQTSETPPIYCNTVVMPFFESLFFRGYSNTISVVNIGCPTSETASSTAAVIITPPKFRKTSSMSLTLPGRIIEAEAGSHVITVSHDLSEYIVAERLAQAAVSCSSEIYLDWTWYDMQSKHIGSAVDGKRHIVENISSYSITLSETYIGPSVTHGNPKVLLRTNLSLAAEPLPTPKAGGETTALPISSSDVPLSSRISCLTCHPSLPYAVVGLTNNQLAVISPDIGRDSQNRMS